MTFKIFRYLFFILTFLPITITNDDFQNNSNNMHLHHGVLTPYKYIANYNTTEIKFPGCEPEKLWIFMRHGERYPFKRTMKRIFNELPLIKKNFQNESYQMIKDWQPSFNFHDHGKLMTNGKRELLKLGERFRMRFPNLITKNCYENIYRYKSTDTRRTQESAKQFGIGLFGKKYFSKCWRPELNDKHLVLQFYNYCNKWKSEDGINIKKIESEINKFRTSDIIKEMLRNITKRIGYKINIHEISLISQTCAYESAFYGAEKYSTWCNILSEQEFKIIEFMNDMYSYWHDGYGIPLTYQQACPMLVDMFDFFSSDSKVKVQAYFGHDTGMWKILALLGIAKDKYPLQYDTYLNVINRKWKSSLISPFAANIAFISYKCNKKKYPSIIFLHQERIVTLPRCPKNKPCPFKIMKKLYPDNNKECNFQKLCNN